MDNNAFEALLRRVVQEELPEELEAFEVSVQALLERASQASSIRDLTHSGRVSFEFGDGVVAVMEFISLLWGTIEAIRKVIDLASSDDKDIEKIQKNWRLELQDAGLSRDKAKRISDRFASDLRDIIER